MTRPSPVFRRTLVAALLLLLPLVAGCGKKPGQRQLRVPVTVATAELRTVPVNLRATGTVESIQSADVGSQVGGVVQSIAIHEGQDVTAGQLLVQLDPRPLRATLEQARGVLARDEANWRSAQLDAERADRLLAGNVIAPADHDKAVAAADALHAALQADSANVRSARLNLDYAGIRSPISGRAGRLNVHIGDLVKAATSDPLVTINQVRPIYVRFTVPESDVPRVQRYRKSDPRIFVTPSAGDSVELEGRLVFVDNAVDATNGTLLLKGLMPNRDGRLWPGEFVEVRLELTRQENALVVPAPAVTNGQQGTYVYVVNADSTTTSRPVKLDRSDDVTAVLSGGLKPGETVVTDGQFRIGPGAKVIIRKAGKEARP